MTDLDDVCICSTPFPGPTDIDPPEPKRDRTCPIHGDLAHTDPDSARERLRESLKLAECFEVNDD